MIKPLEDGVLASEASAEMFLWIFLCDLCVFILFGMFYSTVTEKDLIFVHLIMTCPNALIWNPILDTDITISSVNE